MIGLDTNVLVRYIVQDDPAQSSKANALIESLSSESPGFVAMVSVVELVWVLQSCYRSSKSEIVAVLEALLSAKELVVDRSETVWQALRRFSESKADFADCLIERCANAAGCDHTATFDEKAARTADMRRLTC